MSANPYSVKTEEVLKGGYSPSDAIELLLKEASTLVQSHGLPQAATPHVAKMAETFQIQMEQKND